MNVYTARFIKKHIKSIAIQRFKEGWILLVNDEPILTSRDTIKIYKTIEPIINDLEKITDKPVNKISFTIFNELQDLLI